MSSSRDQPFSKASMSSGACNRRAIVSARRWSRVYLHAASHRPASSFGPRPYTRRFIYRYLGWRAARSSGPGHIDTAHASAANQTSQTKTSVAAANLPNQILLAGLTHPVPQRRACGHRGAQAFRAACRPASSCLLFLGCTPGRIAWTCPPEA